MYIIQLLPKYNISLQIRYYPKGEYKYQYWKSDQTKLYHDLTHLAFVKFRSLVEVFLFLVNAKIRIPENLEQSFQIKKPRLSPRLIERPLLHAPHLYCS